MLKRSPLKFARFAADRLSMSRILSNSPTDPTLDAVPGVERAPKARPCQKLDLVEGSAPHLSSETASLLRMRLRGAALVMFIGFGAFWVWNLLWPAPQTLFSDFVFAFHSAIVLVLAVMSVVLYRCRSGTVWKLRLYETAIFLPPIALFVVGQIDEMVYAARQGYWQNPLPPWFALMFTYALFIPNNWRRAAVVIGIMAIAPILITTMLWQFSPPVARVLSSRPNVFVELALMMTVGAVSSVYGTHMINALRSEAFELRQLGRYRLCRLLGSGGMGEVYLGEHQLLKRPCAIKVIRPHKAADPQALARFEREVQATARLSHWNTVEIFDYGRTNDGTFYYVMEYLPGLSLGELVDRYGPLPASRVIYLLLQTCDALGEAHAMGLIHRDIKPGNVFSAQRGGLYDVAKLLDFGLVKRVVNTTSVQLTQEGAITGSPLYMSPEQAMGETEPDARADIYSLGALAYFLLTGTPPFEGTRAIQVIIAHAHEAVVPPSQLRADIPPDVERVVLRCLAKDPADRYESAAVLSAALADCADAGAWTRADAATWWQSQGAASQTNTCVEVG